MQEIDVARERLLAAGTVPDIIAAAWTAFELAAVTAAAAADGDDALYAALTFAGGAAEDGRDALTFAPSMPAAAAGLAGRPQLASCSAMRVADALAGLASDLGARLREVAGGAASADQAACAAAAARAGQIRALLARSQ